MSRKKLITIIAVCIVAVIVALAISLSGGDPVVNFTDSELETTIRETLTVRETLDKTSGPIYVSELAGLTRLAAYERGIRDISVLRYCTNLTYLYLSYNLISDIAPLANLTNLTYLYLYDNQISDISCLEGLTELSRLMLYGNQISDISYLDDLINLTFLGLSTNQISDISPLVDNLGLGDGDEVDLESNRLSDDSINIYIPELEARGVTVEY
jgi:Leucine-rich repeat (LRR) protein